MSYCYPDVVMHKAALKKLAELNRGDPERRMSNKKHYTSSHMTHELTLEI